jgi:Flp pilus assembly protein TadD
VTALSHTGLADVLEVARAGDFVCVIEEVVPGQTLAELIRERGALDPGQARQVVAQTLLAVDFSHQRHFAHGTVKPSNIFLMDRYLSVKVVDAGLPELLRHVAPARYARLIDSPYVAPEVKEGRPASPASDIYSLGVTFYEMFAGTLPEALRTQGRGSDVGGRFDLLEFETEPSSPAAPEPAEVPSLGDLVSLPPAQISAIEQAMSKSPGHRPPTIRSVRVAFGFAKPTSAHARGAAAGYLGAAAVGGAREVEYELTPAQGGGDPCPACQRPLRPGAPSCLACGYVLPSQGNFDLPDLPAAESSAGTADFLEIDDQPADQPAPAPKQRQAPDQPAAAAVPPTPVPGQGQPGPAQSPAQFHADPLAEEQHCPQIRTGDARVDFFVTQGDRHLAAGRYDEALEAYRSAAGDAPACSLAHNRAGDVLTMTRRYRDAQRHYERAITLNPGDYDARHDLGRVLITRGEVGSAVQHLEAVVSADPSPELRLSALTHLGSAYCAQNLLPQAIEAWSRVVREGPPNAPVRYSLGVALARQGDTESAKAQWRAALEVDPNHAESRAALAQADSPYGGDFMRIQRVPEGPGRGSSLLTGALDALGSILSPHRRYW